MQERASGRKLEKGTTREIKERERKRRETGWPYLRRRRGDMA